jgi:integrase
MAELLRRHAASGDAGTDYVFETRTGTPYDRHNIGRELRRTMKRARDEKGEPTFRPGERKPSLHSFRHTTATALLYAGGTAEDVARRLRHKDSNVTRSVISMQSGTLSAGQSTGP